MAVTVMEIYSSILFIVSSQLFIVSLTPFTIEAELYEGSQCTLENGTSGVCKKIHECPSRLAEVQQGIRSWYGPGRCGFVGSTEIVCCPVQPEFPDKINMETKRPAETACERFSRTLAYHIFGGFAPKRGEFPYVVALGYKNEDPDDGPPIKYTCAGSLISNEHVLTAAHCVHNPDKRVPVEVRLGSDNLTSNEPSVQRIAISDIMYHPEYKYNILYNDVAIIKLKREVSLSELVKPVCLQTESLATAKITPETSFVVLGWGFTSLDDFATSNVLLRTPGLSIVKKDECAKIYKENAKLFNGLDDSMICAIDTNVTRRSDACQGDSGGPLLMVSEKSRSVIGITSFGGGCGGKNPGVYMSVYSFLNWIEEHVWPTNVTVKTNELKFSFSLNIRNGDP